MLKSLNWKFLSVLQLDGKVQFFLFRTAPPFKKIRVLLVIFPDALKSKNQSSNMNKYGEAACLINKNRHSTE